MGRPTCISLTIALIAFTCCLRPPVTTADISLTQNLLKPFNDLLPPILETTEEPQTKPPTAKPASKPTKSTTARPKQAAVVTHVPPQLFKSTKKSYYQQQTEHIKELHLIDDDVLVPHDYTEQAEHLQHLHEAGEEQQLRPSNKAATHKKLSVPPINTAADLPPFRTEPSATSLSAQKVVAVNEQPKFQATSSIINSQPHVLLTHGNLRIPPRNQVALVAPRTKAQKNPQQQFERLRQLPPHRFQSPQRTFDLDLDTLQHYVDSQHVTHRPPKAGLPTLTPFPRHLK